MNPRCMETVWEPWEDASSGSGCRFQDGAALAQAGKYLEEVGIEMELWEDDWHDSRAALPA